MTPLDAAWHLLNALAAPFGVTVITLGVCWLLGWPGGVRRHAVGHLIVVYAAASTAHLGAWWWWGAEGTMAGYSLMVGAAALTLWSRTRTPA